ncbi:acetylxylan esterase [Hymenobacter sp. 5516J-16]|uniref:alpha/beta hydrolase family protein n=1 Tax=Hymenobacter sp. 5516J-16 TaxID=2932253 RepID=UPI001FD08B93|nr:acetylxylan esterase [Hymenobacter sp. 5516J-16]UOQ76642.1 acetylxylan esterase [Hymenobacter sp. 5516J-16]
MRAYQDSARARFRRVLGPLPARTPLKARVTGTLARVGFRIEKVIYESTPNHHVTANLYVPNGKGQRPAVLLFCGHEQESKATESYQKTAILFAQNGFVVLVIDPISQGERMQLTDATGKSLTRGGTTEHTLLNAQAALLGRSVPAAQLWDNVRGLDYLLTRREVDAERVGCLGNSGGATQTAYFLSFDDRVKVAALCSYVAAGERNLELTGPADGCVMLPGAGQAGLDLTEYPLIFAPSPCYCWRVATISWTTPAWRLPTKSCSKRIGCWASRSR